MDYLQHLIERYPQLDEVKVSIRIAYEILVDTFTSSHKLLVAGNGGSAADSEHIVGELMKSFVKIRPPSKEFLNELDKINICSPAHSEIIEFLAGNIQCALPAISLTTHTALNTASANDINGRIIYAQQVYGYGDRDDVFLGISTSGNSENILYAALTAKAKGLKTIALTGGTGGQLARIVDVSIIVPEKETYKIQELHLPIYHTLCLMLEEHFF
jgi:D-sedoheptulose 7-phosphate isomerase